MDTKQFLDLYDTMNRTEIIEALRDMHFSDLLDQWPTRDNE